MDRVLTSLTTIKLTQQAHTQLLAQLVNSAEASSPGLQGLPDLPFGTLADLMDWEAHLGDDKEARLQMKKHMIVQGGDTVKQQTARILKSLMTWHVAKQFSWFGAKGKKKYSDLNICKLMCSSLTEQRGSKEQATLKDIEKAAMSWFRHATERAAAEQKGTRASPVNELI
ncbi:uncharacterized protein LOC144175727 [Haemaphysalis longicornis]